MATPYEKIFKPFMASKNDYDLGPLADFVIEEDMITILNNALPKFRFPKVDLYNKDDETQLFNSDLTYEEINVISILMLEEWFLRCVFNTDVLIQKFGETDFEFKSQASQMRALCETYLEIVKSRSKTALDNYSKSYKGKAFDYTRLAGKGQ